MCVAILLFTCSLTFLTMLQCILDLHGGSQTGLKDQRREVEMLFKLTVIKAKKLSSVNLAETLVFKSNIAIKQTLLY